MRTAASFEGVAVPVSALEGVPLFEGLGPSELDTVAASMRRHDFPAQAVICHEGEPGESMFVVLDGLAHQLAAAPDAGCSWTRSVFAEGRLVGKLRQGDVFGEMSLVTGEPRSATVRAAVPTPALELGEEDFSGADRQLPGDPREPDADPERPACGHDQAPGRRAAARRGRGAGRRTVAAAAVPAVVAAAQAASARPVASLDVGPACGRARAARRRAARPATVVLVAGLHDAELPLLLEHVDRAVVLLGEEDGEPTARWRPRTGWSSRARRASAYGAPRGGTGTPRLVRVAARGDGHDQGGLPPATSPGSAAISPAPSSASRSARAERRATPTSARCACSRTPATRSTTSRAAASARWSAR